eukprot:UN22709
MDDSTELNIDGSMLGLGGDVQISFKMVTLDDFNDLSNFDQPALGSNSGDDGQTVGTQTLWGNLGNLFGNFNNNNNNAQASGNTNANANQAQEPTIIHPDLNVERIIEEQVEHANTGTVTETDASVVEKDPSISPEETVTEINVPVVEKDPTISPEVSPTADVNENVEADTDVDEIDTEWEEIVDEDELDFIQDI